MVVNLHAKFQVSRSNGSRDIEGIRKLESRSRDPFPTPFDVILHFSSSVHLEVNLRAKFEVSSPSRSRDIKGSQNFKVGHVTPFQLF